MIARMWRGWVRTERVGEYVAYIGRTGLAAYRETPGNIGAEMWTRDLGDGRSEVTTLSWWESLDDVRGFAGDEINQAVFYPEDDQYPIDRETTDRLGSNVHRYVTTLARWPCASHRYLLVAER